MSVRIEYGWKRAKSMPSRAVEVACKEKARIGLKKNLFNAVSVALDFSEHPGADRCLLGQRPKSRADENLFPDCVSTLLPLFECGDFWEDSWGVECHHGMIGVCRQSAHTSQGWDREKEQCAKKWSRAAVHSVDSMQNQPERKESNELIQRPLSGGIQIAPG